MIFHALAEDHAVLVVISIGERVDGIDTLEADRGISAKYDVVIC
jgi:hypothetical protein